ncbi:MAG: hypothetical protein AAFW69_04900, partial [Pseudomonadota bacterium]
RLTPDGFLPHDPKPGQILLDLVAEAGFPRIDALKIDVEGADADVLCAFFATAPRALWPRLIVAETNRGETSPVVALLEGEGYVLTAQHRINAVFALEPR